MLGLDEKHGCIWWHACPKGINRTPRYGFSQNSEEAEFSSLHNSQRHTGSFDGSCDD